MIDYNKYSNIPEDENERLLLLMEKFKQKDFSIINKMFSALKSISKSSIIFTLYLVPEPTPRPRYSSKYHRFYVKGARENSILFNEIIKTVKSLPIITTATEVDITTYLPTPSQMNRFEKYFAELGLIPATSTPDWDNLAKAYCDMIQKNLILDDRLIYKGSLTKLYSIKPRVNIRITYNDSYECKFNKNKIEKSKVFIESDYKDRFINLITIIGGKLNV